MGRTLGGAAVGSVAQTFPADAASSARSDSGSSSSDSGSSSTLSGSTAGSIGTITTARPAARLTEVRKLLVRAQDLTGRPACTLEVFGHKWAVSWTGRTDSMGRVEVRGTVETKGRASGAVAGGPTKMLEVRVQLIPGGPATSSSSRAGLRSAHYVPAPPQGVVATGKVFMTAAALSTKVVWLKLAARPCAVEMTDGVGGFRGQPLTPLPTGSDLACPLCTFVHRRPVELPCCGFLACESCLRECSPPACPHCRKTFQRGNPASFPPYSRRRQRDALQVRVACPNAPDGCTWTGTLLEAYGGSSPSHRQHLATECECTSFNVAARQRRPAACDPS